MAGLHTLSAGRQSQTAPRQWASGACQSDDLNSLGDRGPRWVRKPQLLHTRTGRWATKVHGRGTGRLGPRVGAHEQQGNCNASRTNCSSQLSQATVMDGRPQPPARATCNWECVLEVTTRRALGTGAHACNVGGCGRELELCDHRHPPLTATAPTTHLGSWHHKDAAQIQCTVSGTGELRAQCTTHLTSIHTCQRRGGLLAERRTRPDQRNVG